MKRKIEIHEVDTKPQLIYNLFFGNKHSDSILSKYEVLSFIISIFGSILFYLNYKFQDNDIYYPFHFNEIFYLFIIYFSFDFVLRLYSCVRDNKYRSEHNSFMIRMKWLGQPENIFDLLSFIPSIIFGPTIDLRVLRLARIVFLFLPGGAVFVEFKDFWLRHHSVSLRKKIYLLLFQHSDLERLQHFIERFFMLIIFSSILTVILESISSLKSFQTEFRILDTIFVIVFSVEYILRLIVCIEAPDLKSGHFRHLRGAFRGTQIIDLLSILPFYLSIFLPSHLDLRFLRVLRLFPALKLIRYSRASRTLMRVLQDEWPVIAASVFIMSIFVIIIASLGYMFEHEAQPEKFENIPQSIYWAAITLASVGYGDISPLTPSGRVMTVLAAMIGIGIFALPAAILSSSFIDQMHRDREILRENIHQVTSSGILLNESRHEILRNSEDLSLSETEINRIIDQEINRINRELKNRNKIVDENFPRWSENSDEAFEQYRRCVSWLRQIQFNEDAKRKFEFYLSSSDLATKQERIVWEALKVGPGLPSEK